LSSVVGVARRRNEAGLERGQAQFVIFLGRQSTNDETVDARPLGIGEEALEPINMIGL